VLLGDQTRPLSRYPASSTKFSGPRSHVRARGMRNSKQILHGDQRVDHVVALEKIIPTRMLTRDLFAVANLLVLVTGVSPLPAPDLEQLTSGSASARH